MIGGDGFLKTLEEREGYRNSAGYYATREITQLEGGSPYDQVNAQGYMMSWDWASSLSDITYTDQTNYYRYRIGYTALERLIPAFGRGLQGYYLEPGKLNGMITHARMNEANALRFNDGQLHPAFAAPPLGLKWLGYLDNRLDETAMSVFANARHAANKKIGMLSVYKNTQDVGGEGRDFEEDASSFGIGVRSLNIFELNQLV